MKLAFCIYKYFPYGGLQRDFIRIVKAAIGQGHTVDIYAASWLGEKIPNTALNILSVSGWTNHRRMFDFSNALSKILKKQNYDKVIGFNKISGLDVYFAGDVCLKSKLKRKLFFPLFKLFPRYQTYLKLENEVFNQRVKTKILCLTQQQQEEYSGRYHTQPDRFCLIPAGIAPNYLDKEEIAQIRKSARQKLKLNPEQFILLFIASDFQNKGLDRAIKALAAIKMPVLKLLIIGSGRQKPYQALAKKLKVLQQIIFLGTQENLLPYLLSSDLLIHPARTEAAGMVLLEAITAGLPVLTTSNCGYAFHVQKAQSGIVLTEPFQQARLNQRLKEIINSKSKIKEWHINALSYAKQEDLYGMAEKAVEFINQLLCAKAHSS